MTTRYLLVLAQVVLAETGSFGQDTIRFGNFERASSVSFDPNGNVYVSDAGANTVQRFDTTGTPLSEIGGYGWGQLEFDQPYDVSAANGLDVFVADYGNHRVQRFNRKLEYIATLYTRDNADESQRFGYPSGVTISRFGDLFLCDRENHRVLKISGFSKVVRSLGGVDAGKGRLTDPGQVEVGKNDNVYVLERRRIVVFDNFGNYVTTFGPNALKAAAGLGVFESSVFVADSDRVLVFNQEGGIERIIPCPDMTEPENPCVDVAADPGRIVMLMRHRAVMLRR